MDALHPDGLERLWWRTVLLLALLVALFALLKHASWPAIGAAAEPAIGAAVEPPMPRHDAITAKAPAPPQGLLFPLAGFEGALRDNFDEKRGMRTHQALDIMAPRGTPVRAVDAGRIARLYRGPLAGIAIYQFNRDATRVYFYAHLDRYAAGLADGQAIERGEVIGYVGSTGNAPERAPHLHFAMHELGPDKRWWRGKAVNPYELLRSGTQGLALENR